MMINILTLVTSARSNGLEMLYKIGVLKNVDKIHRKKPVPESLFTEVTGLYHATLLKEKTPIQVFSD